MPRERGAFSRAKPTTADSHLSGMILLRQREVHAFLDLGVSIRILTTYDVHRQGARPGVRRGDRARTEPGTADVLATPPPDRRLGGGACMLVVLHLQTCSRSIKSCKCIVINVNATVIRMAT